jgi:predicted metal-dependent phosphoesterase TrpH
MGELLDGAHPAGIEWIAFTEHTRHARFEPAQGRIEGVTLIPGWEFSAAGGSILALGIGDRTGLPRDPAALIAAIHARGGAAFIGHIESSALVRPERFAELGADGIELANLHATANEVRFRLALGELFLPARFGLRALLRTQRDNLQRWVRLPEARAIVGGVDAHAKFRVLGRAGGTLDRYRDVLRLLTTHVLARDASAPAILEALRRGRSYLVYEGLAPVDRLEVATESGALRIRAPRPARLDLICESGTVASKQGAEVLLRLPIPARACHVEAWLGSHLWIATSHLPWD